MSLSTTLSISRSAGTESPSTKSKVMQTLSFRLSKIDPNEIIRNYERGDYEKATIPKSRIALGASVGVMAPTYGTNPHSGVFTITDKTGNVLVSANSNQRLFQVFTTTGGDLPKGGKSCIWCRQEYKTDSVGVPIKMEVVRLSIPSIESKTEGSKSSIETSKTLGSNINEITVTVFWAEEFACDYPCAYAQARYLTMINRTAAQAYTIGADYYVKSMFALQYPDTVLTPAKDWKLLEANGGSLSLAEWKNPKYTYIRSMNVLTIPAKFQYLRYETVPGNTGH